MSKKHRNAIPDFSSRKPQHLKPGVADANAPANAPAKAPPPAPRVKPQAGSAKSGRRGQ